MKALSQCNQRLHQWHYVAEHRNLKHPWQGCPRLAPGPARRLAAAGSAWTWRVDRRVVPIRQVLHGSQGAPLASTPGLALMPTTSCRPIAQIHPTCRAAVRPVVVGSGDSHNEDRPRHTVTAQAKKQVIEVVRSRHAVGRVREVAEPETEVPQGNDQLAPVPAPAPQTQSLPRFTEQ